MLSRRRFLQQLSGSLLTFFATTTSILVPRIATAQWPKQWFQRSSFDKTMEQLFGHAKLNASDKIHFRLPLIAENGAVVPITIKTNHTNVDSITLLVEKNPVPLIAQFKFSPTIEPTVSARFKMAETSDVIAIISSEGEYFSKRQSVKVTIGGCGG